MRFMSFVLLGILAHHAVCDSTFRFGAVLSTVGRTRAMSDAKKGYELYFDAANTLNDGRGFFVQGKPETQGFHFKYEFLWREDFSDRHIHKEEVAKLLDEDNIHFLGGSHQKYALQEMRLANDSDVLCYHCCVAPDTVYEKDYPTTFGIAASNAEFTDMLVRRLTFENVSSVGIVYEDNDEFTKTTCEAAKVYIEELGIGEQENRNLVLPFNSSDDLESHTEDFALRCKEKQIEAVIACVDPDKGRRLVTAFDEAKYSLKAFFLTVGPSKQWWVDSFENGDLANGLLSSAQWHQHMNYYDEFFNSTHRYVKMFKEKFSDRIPDQDAAGASAVGLTLTQAITKAFSACDISKTKGDVDVLLYDLEAIECDDDLGLSGYARILSALSSLNVETFYGKVEFNYFRRNVGLDPVTTQVFERKADGEKYREIEPVLPFGYATELLQFPAKNRFREKCPAGHYVGPDPFEPCRPCIVGEASQRVDANHCDSCPIGQWVNETGQSVCMSCPSGTFTNFTGATKMTDCICKAGFFNRAGENGVACEPCPEGAKCAGGTELPAPLQGYWYSRSNKRQVHECDPGSVCLGGAESTCEEGYSGRLCSECADGYFSIIQKCYLCFNSSVIILLLILLLVSWYVINVIVSQSVASLEMILSWAQLANIIGDINLNWTRKLTTMFGIANILDFDVDILEPSCLLSWGFRQNFVVQLCLPFIMTIMAACGYLFSVLVFTAIESEWIKLEGHAREILAFFVEVPENRADLRKKWDASIATFLASVDITYVTIAKYCFDCFKCSTISGTSVLDVAPEIECGSLEHTQLVILASLGIAFYVLGYLGYIIWKLYDLHDRRAFLNEVNILRFGFVYQKYELAYYFTPAIALIRKLMFVFVLVYINNPAFQVGTLAIVINASLMIHVYTAPYVETYLDILFNFLLLALMFEAFGGLMFYSENLPAENRDILEWIVMGALFLLIFVFIVICAMEIVKKYHVYFLKKKHREFAKKEYGYTSRGCLSGLWLLRKKNRNSFIRRVTSIASGTSSLRDDKDVNCELVDTFDPAFVYKVLKKRPDFIQDWDKLTKMLKDYMSDQSETSYLSMEPTAKFWRKLVDRFPELIDFLAVADKEARDHFNHFATHLYENFYLSKKLTPLPLMDVLNWRDHAPMAQWLAIAPEEDRMFFFDFVSEMFRTAGNEEAAALLESKLENGGQDPGLVSRTQHKRVSRKQKWILESMQQGSNPFTHSASKRVVMATNSLVGAQKFCQTLQSQKAKNPKGASTQREKPSTERSCFEDNEPPVYLTSAEGNTTDEVSSQERSEESSCSNEVRLNNQTSFKSEGDTSLSKVVCFSLDCDQISYDAE